MNRVLRSALWAIGIWCAPAVLAAQQPATGGDSAHEAMQTRMEEWDRRLEQKLAEVDRTKGDKKVAAMAAAMRELLAQRREMHQQMAHGGPGQGGPRGAMPGCGCQCAGMPGGSCQCAGMQGGTCGCAGMQGGNCQCAGMQGGNCQCPGMHGGGPAGGCGMMPGAGHGAHPGPGAGAPQPNRAPADSGTSR